MGKANEMGMLRRHREEHLFTLARHRCGGAVVSHPRHREKAWAMQF